MLYVPAMGESRDTDKRNRYDIRYMCYMCLQLGKVEKWISKIGTVCAIYVICVCNGEKKRYG